MSKTEWKRLDNTPDARRDDRPYASLLTSSRHHAAPRPAVTEDSHWLFLLENLDKYVMHTYYSHQGTGGSVPLV